MGERKVVFLKPLFVDSTFKRKGFVEFDVLRVFPHEYTNNPPEADVQFTTNDRHGDLHQSKWKHNSIIHLKFMSALLFVYVSGWEIAPA